MRKALIWGESLVGSGHARIQSELARQLRAQGWSVACVTSSKAHTDNFDFGGTEMVYQPPLRLKSRDSDPYNMASLVTPSGKTLATDEAYRRLRRERLLEFYRAFRPTVVVTEMWPYARANFDFELVPLAEAIAVDPRVRMYSIARDIMFPPRLSSPDSPNLDNDRHGIAAEFFRSRSILVRGDRAVIPLEASTGTPPDMVRGIIDYVGYFACSTPPRAPAVDADRKEVLVSSGGGVTQDSLILFRQAIRARRHSAFRDRVWRIFVPHICPDEVFAELEAMAQTEAADGGIVVERNRRDFLALLANAELVICHAGNTVIEAVTAQVAVLVVPRGMAKNNREQQVRAKAFFDKGLVGVASLEEIGDPRVLAAKADAAAATARPATPIMVDGAARMAQRLTADYYAEFGHSGESGTVIPFGGRIGRLPPAGTENGDGTYG
jgi:predicted glycosyltransferase